MTRDSFGAVRLPAPRPIHHSIHPFIDVCVYTQRLGQTAISTACLNMMLAQLSSTSTR